ncbi:MAG TPA: multidrug transporter [Terriglobia bacterium]|nr:multidrug transporter [Terriglobia bacterium]
MKASIKGLAALGFVLLAAAVLLRTYAQFRGDPPQDTDDEEEAVKMPSRVSVTNGQTSISLDAATRQRMGVEVARVRTVDSTRQEPAAATVLATGSLVTLRNSYVAAGAQLQKAQAQLAVSNSEYERLQALYNENQNVSQKALEAARGAVQIDRASVDAAQKTLSTAASAAQQSWGGAVAGWVAGGSPLLASVLDQQSVLVQLTLPLGGSLQPPRRILLSTPGGSTATADYVSPFPQVDPRIQGVSELYVARAYPALEPAMNLLAHLPVGRRLHGVLIPQSAVVWWRGAAWVYQRVSDGHFVREAAPTDMPLSGGYFAGRNFTPETRLVVRGAQFLLSEEFRSQIQPED